MQLPFMVVDLQQDSAFERIARQQREQGQQDSQQDSQRRGGWGTKPVVRGSWAVSRDSCRDDSGNRVRLGRFVDFGNKIQSAYSKMDEHASWVERMDSAPFGGLRHKEAALIHQFPATDN